MRAYIDSDVLIWHLRGEQKARDLLLQLRDEEQYDLYTGAIQRAEVVFFMKPEEEQDTKLFLSQIKTRSVDQEIVDNAAILYRKWNPSHGIDVNDAILAATVIQTGGRIYTLNIKHFPMPGINVQKAW
ncbi:PIN domain-containing protein [Desulfotignum balticum]|uniref:PIN domain-containing protein n=1 Tax=Desulfotignum balticum TaxID=115781 RepID=UPI000462B89E|nr:PIN domain-containing protein [Desulfotignum balticum]